MNIARFSVTRPVAVTMRIAVLVLLGAICLTKLPIDLLPKVSIPTVAVITQWPNVAPEELETQITRPIEESVSQAPNINNVSSSTVEGVSTVRVQFNWGTDIGQAAVDVLQLVQRARQNFPNDPTLTNPIVFKYDPSTLPILIFGVSGEEDPIKLRMILDNQVTPLLESANGVASAVVTGGMQRAIIVNVDPEKLRAYHLTLDDVSRRITQENLNLPAGIARQGNTEYTIRSLGYFNSVKEAETIPVGVFNGQLVKLKDVASVEDSHQEVRLMTRLNGQPACGVIITKQSQANTVETAKNVMAKLDQIKKLYPNLKFGLAYDQSQFIANSIEDVKNSAVIGGFLAILILLMFLRNFRSTFVVALSIPISIISTFALLYLCGFTINTLSLSGLALATGLIVDDAVVVLENIFRHIERDKQRVVEAAVSGTQEIMGAVIASTLTIMIVFLPLFLLQGQSGQMFSQFALVVIFSIAVSLLDAITVVPMLASRLIKQEEVEEEAEAERGHITHPYGGPVKRLFNWFGKQFLALDNSYRNGLAWALQHRWWVIGGAVLVTGVSLLLIPQIGTEMLPQTDSGDFTVILKMPVGTALEQTDNTMKRAEQIVLANKNVATVFSAAGTTLSLRGASTALTPYMGSMTVKLKEDRTASTAQVIASLQKDMSALTGARVLITPYDLVTLILTGGAQNIEVDIFGPDIKTLSSLSKQTMDKLRVVPGLESVDVAIQDATPEIQWQVDREKAQQFGISFSDIANVLNTATNGQLSSYYQEGGFQYPIYVQVPESKRKTVSDLLNLPISRTIGASPAGASGSPAGASGSLQGTPGSAGSATGSTSSSTVAGSTDHIITLQQVAKQKNEIGPSEIDRLDRQRYFAVTGRATGRSEGEVQVDIEKAMSDIKLPQGYYWDYGINQKRRGQEYSGLGLAIFMAIALIYMLLASQFESFVTPLTVLVSVPLSAVGVLLALFLTGRAFGLTAFIGLLMLIGIVVKNGILLVDYTDQLRGRGKSRDEAVLTASPTRLRPILMTASAAILGMLPLAMAIGKGSETQAPLATSVIGGLATSTFLTLFVVPVVYTIFDDIARFFRKDKRDLARPEIVEPSVEAIEREAGHDATHSPTLPKAVD
ncbi:MAG TPA: efflux RND transporter permease subunit [Chthonomonadaceae bacterium]|nr:efflux RND transporter permease subunit [Chthonomonadaceae bacterium]